MPPSRATISWVSRQYSPNNAILAPVGDVSAGAFGAKSVFGTGSAAVAVARFIDPPEPTARDPINKPDVVQAEVASATSAFSETTATTWP